jgi:hypothetical protein
MRRLLTIMFLVAAIAALGYFLLAGEHPLIGDHGAEVASASPAGSIPSAVTITREPLGSPVTTGTYAQSRPPVPNAGPAASLPPAAASERPYVVDPAVLREIEDIAAIAVARRSSAAAGEPGVIDAAQLAFLVRDQLGLDAKALAGAVIVNGRFAHHPRAAHGLADIARRSNSELHMVVISDPEDDELSSRIRSLAVEAQRNAQFPGVRVRTHGIIAENFRGSPEQGIHWILVPPK